MEKFDSIIIGAGPAGIMSAIYLYRSNIKDICVFSLGPGALKNAAEIENLYGFEKISGEELFNKGIAQAKKLGISVKEEIVTHITYLWDSEEIEIKTDKGEYLAKSLVFATGKKRNSLNVKGVKELEGNGVSYCATCDGFFYRKKKVAVIGHKEFAFNEYDYLANLAGEITLLTNGENLETSRNIDTRKLKELKEENGQIKVIFQDDNYIVVDGVFVALGNASSTDFARQLGIEISENNDIIVNENCQTNISNIFAAGDCTGGILQISKAEYQGMIVGMKLGNYLRGKK